MTDAVLSIIPLVLVVAFILIVVRYVRAGGGFAGRTEQAVGGVVALFVALLIIFAFLGGGGDNPEPMEPSLFTFTVEDGKATITGWAAEEPAAGYDLVIPTTDGEGHPVTAIVMGVYNEETQMTDIPFPGAKSVTSSTVTEVQTNAFFNSVNLLSISLPEAITIVDSAFYGCTSLASVSLPKATTIDYLAFSGCTSLASVSLPKATDVGNSAFSGCTSLASVSLKAEANIGASAFDGCTGIESVTFGPLSDVSSYAFGDWTFYASDGATVLDKTVAANLANSTFRGTASALVKVP